MSLIVLILEVLFVAQFAIENLVDLLKFLSNLSDLFRFSLWQTTQRTHTNTYIRSNATN
jgi:hypothetical protein